MDKLVSNSGKKAVIGSPDTGLDNNSTDKLTEMKDEENPYTADQNISNIEHTFNDDNSDTDEYDLQPPAFQSASEVA